MDFKDNVIFLLRVVFSGFLLCIQSSGLYGKEEFLDPIITSQGFKMASVPLGWKVSKEF
jgi:hypothetical protein